ncbi:MAG: recombination protein RecR [Candidatus Aminicenantes bacterium]|nr:recombination protein RecR [Candidatus Aminicenantes bacterium]RLE04695.1 MAG: recombination protein RecR [Candidatus Aminicenantes bacterium]
MAEREHPIERLIEELKRIPTIGAKTAQRIAYYLFNRPQEELDRLAAAIKEVKQGIKECSICHNLSPTDPCAYCQDEQRDDRLLCVVEEPYNIASIEKSGVYQGRYHVLRGALSPLKGIGPDELKIDSLIRRVEKGQFEEVIIATNTTSEGEATAVYLARKLKPFPVKVTRLAMGLPVGTDIDYADQVTLRKAIEGRLEIKD